MIFFIMKDIKDPLPRCEFTAIITKNILSHLLINVKQFSFAITMIAYILRGSTNAKFKMNILYMFTNKILH